MYKNEIESKFAPNQEVWFLYNNKIYCKPIKYIEFLVYEKQYLIKYSIERIEFAYESFKFTEDRIFTTKEELIKSL